MRVLASCDSIYFLEHHKAYYTSAKAVGYTPYIHVINPTPEVMSIIKTLSNITVELNSIKNVVYYACNRFYMAKDYLQYEGILVTDIDCIFNKYMEAPEEDIGLFFRNRKEIHAKLAVGIVWMNSTPGGRKFAYDAANLVQQEKQVWFADQIGVYKAYDLNRNSLTCFTFEEQHMDWTFKPTSYMWTGKGSRKFRDRIYVNKKKQYENSNSYSLR